jgi:hypothetical protein
MARTPSNQNQTVCCPARGVCLALGVATRNCCAPASSLQPAGMAVRDPRLSWCPPALRAAVMMLAYSAAGPNADSAENAQTLALIRQWADGLRRTTSPYPSEPDCCCG